MHSFGAHSSGGGTGGLDPRDRAVPAPRLGHDVQFYEDEGFLEATVASYLGEGARLGQPLVVIATPGRRHAIRGHLAGAGLDVDGATRRGELTLLDARETLDRFMRGAVPDPARFRAAIAPVLESSRSRSRDSTIRLYGEMVDVLSQEGNHDGALAVEELWNEIGTAYPFSLLCAYAMRSFRYSSDAERFQRICRAHAHVTPTERYTKADDASRLLEISVLQQRARALETEVAEREQLERRLREALGESERCLVAERAARAEADEARQLAEQANRAKADFLAVMSHELRTPLNAIAGYAELLELGVHGPLAEQQREALGRIQRSQQHLLGLITEVLNYARVESGGVRYEIVDVVAADALRAAEALLVPQMRAKAIDYACPGCASDVVVRADREKLQQILLNLLANATKFTDRGGRIRLECEADETTVRMRVRDSGVGIPPEQLEQIFEPFFQVDGKLTRAHDGVGLGLAISRTLARGMGGELTAESRLGFGSVLTLSLPRAAPR